MSAKENKMIDALRYASYAVNHLIGVKPGENVLIIVDTATEPEVYKAFAAAVNAAGGEFTIAIQPSRTEPKDFHKLTEPIKKAYEGADVVIPATASCGAALYGASPITWPLLREKKLRQFSFNQRSLRNLTEGGATADYDEIRKNGEKLKSVLEKGKKMKITTELGSNLTAGMEGREMQTELGFARNPGQSGCLPDGEVSFDPVSGSANGILYVDGPIANIGVPSTPVKITVSNGKITAVEGGCEEAGRFEHVIKTIENADNFAEIAIGLNPKSQRTGEFNEEKKGLGNIHVACGRSAGSHRKFEVWSTIHYDMVIHNPTIELDGRIIVDKGRHVY